MSPRPGAGGAVETILFHALALLLVLAPLPLGANREWAWTAAALWAGALAIAWALAAMGGRARVSAALGATPIVLFGAVCAWAWLQGSAGLPENWSHPLWSLAAEAGAGNTGGTVSLAPDDGATALMRYLAYGLVFGLSYQLCRRASRARQLFTWLSLAGLVGAVYGLAAFWGRWETMLWAWPFDYRPVVHGTFVNRNHFATWLGLGILCTVALAVQHGTLRRNPVYRLPTVRGLRLEELLMRHWRQLSALIVMTAALVLTNSRGGFFSTLAAVAVLMMAVQGREAFARRGTRWLLAAIGVLAACVFWLSSEVLLGRLDQSTVDLQTRMEAYALAADGIDDSPLHGFGYGTFADSFRLYRDERLPGHFDKAHNTYLENVFELGWPFALLQFALVGWLAGLCLRGWRRRRRDWIYPATGVAATVLVAAHAMVDFSLQIPAVAMTYAAIMGAACAQAFPRPIYSPA